MEMTLSSKLFYPTGGFYSETVPRGERDHERMQHWAERG
jgi:hypothetical protein